MKTTSPADRSSLEPNPTLPVDDLRPRFDLKRIRGQLVVLVLLAGMIGLDGFLLRPWLGGEQSWFLVPTAKPPILLFQLASRKLVGARRDLAKAENGKFGVVVGSSTMMYSIDPTLLDTGDGWRWLGLGVMRSDISELCRIATLALRGGRHPDTLVFAVNTSQFASSSKSTLDPTRFDFSEIRYHAARRYWIGVKDDLEDQLSVPWNLLLPNRTRISSYWEKTSFVAQQDLFALGGRGLDAVYPPDPSPWTLPHPMPGVARMPQGYLEELKHAWKREDYFNVSHYRGDSPPVKSFTALVRQAQVQGVDVILVLLPESPDYRRWRPVNADSRILGALKDELGEKSPEVIDLRAVFEDSYFVDYIHVNDKARAPFTRILSARLSKIVNR